MAPAKITTALVGGRVHPDPAAPVIPDGVVLIERGRITAVGRRADVPVPGRATVIDCSGTTVTSGFWNSHVHFTSVKFHQADRRLPAGLADALRALLTSCGVVHAVDTGSVLANTLALRRRIESGEIPGPVDPDRGHRVRPARRQPVLPLAGPAARADDSRGHGGAP